MSNTAKAAKSARRTLVDAGAIEPALVGVDDAAAVAGVSPSYWELHDQGKTPASIKLGGGTRRLWRLSDIRRWVELGCPDRKQFEAAKAKQELRK